MKLNKQQLMALKDSMILSTSAIARALSDHKERLAIAQHVESSSFQKHLKEIISKREQKIKDDKQIIEALNNEIKKRDSK